MTTSEQEQAAVRALVEAEPTTSTSASHTAAGLQRLCRAAMHDLPAHGVGVAVISATGDLMTAAASGAETEQIEELQFTLGEGPCFDAYASHVPVLVAKLDAAAMSTWPAYAPAVHARGVRAVFAFPLNVGLTRLGALDLYRRVPGELSERELTRALSFAEVASQTVLDAYLEDGELASFATDVTHNRFEVHQAQGMVMVQLGVSAEHALALLRAHAFALDRGVAEVANDVIARRLVLRPDGQDRDGDLR